MTPAGPRHPGTARTNSGTRSGPPPDPDQIVEPDAARAITAVRPFGTDGTRAAVFIDRRRIAIVPIDDVEALGLAPGVPWDRDLCARLTRAARRLACRRDAARLLGARDRPRADLARKLAQKRHDRESIDAVLDRLEDVGAIDDARFAEAAAANLARQGGRGTRLIEQKLRAKGVRPDEARAAARAATEGADQARLALDAARKRAARLAGLDPDAARRRLYAFLARRGFDPDDCRRAVDQALDELHAG